MPLNRSRDSIRDGPRAFGPNLGCPDSDVSYLLIIEIDVIVWIASFSDFDGLPRVSVELTSEIVGYRRAPLDFLTKLEHFVL